MSECELKSVKEIAASLGRCEAYVYRLRRAMMATGAAWIGGRTTVQDVKLWLAKNQNFRSYAKFTKFYQNLPT